MPFEYPNWFLQPGTFSKHFYLLFHHALASFLIFIVSTLSYGQYTEKPWMWTGEINTASNFMSVNIDGDDIQDLLIYNVENNVVTSAYWERHSQLNVSLVRKIKLPDFPVWTFGVIDIDQDGDGDLLFTNKTTGLLYVAKQLCDFQFSEAKRVESTSVKYGGFKIHDANHDGIEDLVGGSFTEPFTYVMQLGRGNGKFDDPRTVFIGYTEIFAQRYQDLDGDGFTDIIVTTGGADRIVYYPGQASGGWGSEKTILTGTSNPWGSAIGDIDGDGHKDVIVASFTGGPNSVILARNKGDNTFEKKTLIAGLTATSDLECADLNGDGLDDILLSSANGEDTWIYRNNGNFNFTKTKLWNGFRGDGYFTDVDGDQNLDVVIKDLDFGSVDVLWWKGNKNGLQFESKGSLYPRDVNLTQYIIGDFNQDHIPDIVFVTDFLHHNALWYSEGLGDGNFKPEEALFKIDYITSLQMSDFNHDDKNDLVYTYKDQMWVSLNLNNGKFAEPEFLQPRTRLIQSIDMRHDQYMDYLMIDPTRDSLFLLSFEPDGSSSKTLMYKGKNIFYLLYDFNQDGYEDCSMYDYSESILKIYISHSGTFINTYSKAEMTQYIPAIKSMDYDLDGISDILLVSGIDLFWMKGDSASEYAEPELITLDGKVYDFAVLDIDVDGRQDLYVTDSDRPEGYYKLIAPSTFGSKKYILYQGESVNQFSELNHDQSIEVLNLDQNGNLSWWSETNSSHFPYVILEYPCDPENPEIIQVIKTCQTSAHIVWEDGTVGDSHGGFAIGEHNYYVLLDQDTLETVNFEINTIPIAINQIEISSDDGSSNGSFEVDIQGGSPPYAITWVSSNGMSGDSTAHLDNGTYDIHILDANGCFLDTSIVIPLVTSVVQAQNINAVKVYPSPTRQQLTIESSDDMIEGIKIINSFGRVETIQAMHTSSDQLRLDVSNYVTGLYYIQIKTSNSLITQKFIKI